MAHTFRTDPEWLRARADLVEDIPDEDPDIAHARRTDAALRLRDIERAYDGPRALGQEAA